MVASVPISMQVECTSTMALGSRALAEKQAIVSRLASIEALAGMDMLCSGKTGTLTLNITTIESKLPWGQISEQQWLLFAFLATRWTQYAKRIWTVTQVSTTRLSCRTGNGVDADGVGPSAFHEPDHDGQAELQNMQRCKCHSISPSTFRCA